MWCTVPYVGEIDSKDVESGHQIWYDFPQVFVEFLSTESVMVDVFILEKLDLVLL